MHRESHDDDCPQRDRKPGVVLIYGTQHADDDRRNHGDCPDGQHRSCLELPRAFCCGHTPILPHSRATYRLETVQGRKDSVAQLLILTPRGTSDALPALTLLDHRVRTMPAEPALLVNAPPCDVIIVDARADLAGSKALCKILHATGLAVPLLIVVTEGGLTAMNAGWGADDILLTTAGPAEVDARVRIALGRRATENAVDKVIASGVVIDEANYSVKVHGRSLDLTFKEFELLRFLAMHPSRVFTREQLLSDVWGYDYFGGTRTVDVHVRRLRAKLGDQESVIGTVRNVGYRFNVIDEDESERIAESLHS